MKAAKAPYIIYTICIAWRQYRGAIPWKQANHFLMNGTPGATADLIACGANPAKDLGVLGGQGEGICLVIKDGRIVKPLV